MTGSSPLEQGVAAVTHTHPICAHETEGEGGGEHFTEHLLCVSSSVNSIYKRSNPSNHLMLYLLHS